MKSKTYYHAEKELDILEEVTPDAIILPFTKEILALCDAFGKGGQSGGSAPFYADVISKAVYTLCLQNTLAPLTGEDSEWELVEMDGVTLWQNNRNSAVFKDENGRCYFTDAIIWTDGDDSVYGTREDIPSCLYIKEFPFTPKTFFIETKDVIVSDGYDGDCYERDVLVDAKEGTYKPEKYIQKIWDKSQLIEVFKLYEK